MTVARGADATNDGRGVAEWLADDLRALAMMVRRALAGPDTNGGGVR